MGKTEVRAYLDQIGRPDLEILEFPVSSATVELAAAALGVPPGQIAKTLALRVKDQVAVVVLAGTARLDNKKVKQFFGGKARLLPPEETLAVTGHPVGGVCPFGLPEGLAVYLDESLKAFTTVYPAGGAGNTGIKITVAEFAALCQGRWADLSIFE